MLNIKKDFPIFCQSMNGKPLVYLDSASSSQKPVCLIDAISHYYRCDYANAHRGIYGLAERSTRAYERTREKIRAFIHAESVENIIFTRGTTEGINLVAQSFGRAFFKENDEVILSVMEHHSNIVPWQLLRDQIGIVLKVIPMSDEGELDLSAYEAYFSSKTRLVSVSHISNVLGTVNPIKKMIAMAHSFKVPVLVDGAGALAHQMIDVQDLDCDFYVCSAHKAYGPTGVGVVYGKTEHLEKMLPYQGGGSMIETVSFEKTTYAQTPQKFEAGTPNLADVVGFYSAIEYMEKIGMNQIMQHEQKLLNDATTRLSELPGIRLLGTAKHKVGIISFVMDAAHSHDIGTVLDHEGIAVRAGHHCAMPLMNRLGVPACVRVSFGVYNTLDDIDALMKGMQLVQEVFH